MTKTWEKLALVVREVNFYVVCLIHSSRHTGWLNSDRRFSLEFSHAIIDTQWLELQSTKNSTEQIFKKTSSINCLVLQLVQLGWFVTWLISFFLFFFVAWWSQGSPNSYKVAGSWWLASSRMCVPRDLYTSCKVSNNPAWETMYYLYPTSHPHPLFFLFGQKKFIPNSSKGK